MYISICRDLELDGKVMVLLMVKYGMLVPLKPVDLLKNSQTNNTGKIHVNVNSNASNNSYSNMLIIIPL